MKQQKGKGKEQQDSSSEDEDYRLGYKQANKSKQYQFTQTIKKEDVQNFNQNILKERGFDIDDNEFSQFKGQTEKEKKIAQGAMISGQAVASLKELEKELNQALNKNNKQLASSLLSTILTKDLQRDIKKAYAIQKCKLAYELKQYANCAELCEQYQNLISKK